MDFIIKSIFYTAVAAGLYTCDYSPREASFWVIMGMAAVFDMLFVGSITARLRNRGKKAAPMQETAKETTGQG